MTIKEARAAAGLTQQAMSERMKIPKRSIESWEGNQRKCPPYVERFIINELLAIAAEKNQ